MDRIAVVTGAAGGIGRRYATGLAEDGFTVVIGDLNEAGSKETVEIIKAAGGKAAAHVLDVSDPVSAKAFADFVDSGFGRLDVLMNNAALFGGMKLSSAMEADIAYWRKMFQINLDGALIMTQALAPLMIRSGGGRIVNQSSTAAYMGSGNSYSVSKAAINALTIGLAGELAQHGITVNAIAPGPVPTEAFKGVVPKELAESLINRTPISRLGSVDDMLNALRFFARDDSGWVTGQILIVDGGAVKRF